VLLATVFWATVFWATMFLAQAPAAAPDAAAPSEAALRNSPDWLRLPSDAELVEAYPAAARAEHVRGRAVLDCGLTENGRLSGCAVVEEDPAGYGFGAAALKLAVRFQMTPLRPDGEPVAGGRIRIPIHFAPQRR
jgi:protein TonB